MNRSRHLTVFAFMAICLGAILTNPARAVSQVQLGDLDADGEHTVFDLVRLINHVHGATQLPASSLPVADLDGNQVIDGADIEALSDIVTGAATANTLNLAQIAETSPASGETGVSATRETILRFTKPLAPDNALGADALVAEFAGERLQTRQHVSPDRQTLTLFYAERLPASAVIRLTIAGDKIADHEGIAVDADADGLPGGSTTVDFETLSLTAIGTTAVCGRVFASEPDLSGGGQAVNRPLQGVRITVDGMENTLFAVTDDVGNFRLEPAPAGRFFVHIDGRTATNADIPAGAYYPFVGKAWESVPNIEINVGNIYLPLVRDGTLTQVSANAATEVAFPQTVIDANPALGRVRLTVPSDALFSDDGSRGGMVGIAPVDPERLPGQLPENLNFPLVITVQTDGATNFDAPVPICFPNLPDPVTGAVLGPGEKSALWSFNHDTGRFEIIGSMTVSEDGTLVCTDPGVGVLAPGWHGSRPGVGASGGNIFSSGGGGGGDDDPAGEANLAAPATGLSETPPACPLTGEKGPCPQLMLVAYNAASHGSAEGSDVDPVYLFSGEFYLQVEDLRIPGRGLDFIWSRKYRSRVTRTTPQGNGWDASYNVFLFEDDGDLVVCDGNSRADRFERQAATGRWIRPEFFREILRNANGTFTMEYENRGKWVFHALDGSAQQGKLKAIIDRNDNTLTLFYNPLGQLIRVRDTLDRNIDLAYNGDGRLTTITDFAGRTVRYAYYGSNEAGGNAGDLKSCTAPAVTGTPNGNDFPAGKTITYTYSKHGTEERLRGNLLTVTDAKGQTWLRNRYAPTTNPDALDFDRLIEQQWGDSGDLVHLSYANLRPYGNISRGNLPAGAGISLPERGALAGASAKTTVNDRNGHVSEYYYDSSNRLVLTRHYTGRANPDQPSSGGQAASTNPPQNRVRGGDPAFFETQFRYNADSLLQEVRYPNGNLTRYEYESDINPNSPRRSLGNIRLIRQLPGPLAGVSAQNEIVETFDYAADFNCGGCGANFVTRHTDARGAVTQHSYDSRGNRVRTVHRISSVVEEFEYNAFGQVTAHVLPDNGSNHRRRDVYHYHGSGIQRGYLSAQIIDARGEALTTRFAYDAVGNRVGVTDPKGNDSQFVYNQLDQLVRAISREVTPGSGLRYQQDFVYDANNNRTQVDVINIDENGVLQLDNTHFTTRWEYDILNYPVRKIAEVTPTKNIVTEIAYDANRNVTVMRSGEATSGRQPANTVTIEYDERDLPYRQILAAGHTDQSTTQFDYDGNGNLVATAQGIESAPRITRFDYDGYDRRILTTDAMGNTARVTYDANSNIVQTRADGELVDVPGNANNIRLTQASLLYDPLDRLTQSSADFFTTADGLPIGDGKSITTVTYADTSQLLSVTDDNGHTTFYAYDSVNRMATTTDAGGNRVTYRYDANSNVNSALLREKHDLAGRADELFTTTFAYDNLDRRTSTTDNVGNRVTQVYDSRHNLRRIDDALGNLTLNTFDGLNRLLKTIRFLTDTGLGGGVSGGTIEVSQVWDDAHRVVSRIDDNGNTSETVHDPLDRPTQMIEADSTRRDFLYDSHHNIIDYSDANNNRIVSAYDLLNRTVRRDITPGPATSNQTTFEIFRFDGLSRLVAAEDDDSLVLRTHDSLSQVTGETLNGQTTSLFHDGVGNLLTCTYPGGRAIANAYDPLDRKSIVQDATNPNAFVPVATLNYTGPNRVARIDYGNGTRADYDYDGITGRDNPPNDFGVQRMITSRYSHSATGTSLSDFHYRWDRMGNKIERNDITGALPNQGFSYDSAYRLVQSSGSASVEYTLDGAHNRLAVTGGPDAGNYLLEAGLPEPADAQLNQYTQTPHGNQQHDKNGNLLSDAPGRNFTYDYANRMTGANAGGTSASYHYDAFGRRISKTVNGTTTFFFYNAEAQVCEEQDGGNNTTATYVFENAVDGPLQMQRGSQPYFYHQDDLSSTVALTDQSGALVDSASYGDYGQPSETSSVGNPYLFTGRRYDSETGFYYYRTRYLDPRAGRFTSRDIIGAWGDVASFGNALSYVGSNPMSYLDPFGLTKPSAGEKAAYFGAGAGSGFVLIKVASVLGPAVVAGVKIVAGVKLAPVVLVAGGGYLIYKGISGTAQEAVNLTMAMDTGGRAMGDREWYFRAGMMVPTAVGAGKLCKGLVGKIVGKTVGIPTGADSAMVREIHLERVGTRAFRVKLAIHNTLARLGGWKPVPAKDIKDTLLANTAFRETGRLTAGAWRMGGPGSRFVIGGSARRGFLVGQTADHELLHIGQYLRNPNIAETEFAGFIHEIIPSFVGTPVTYGGTVLGIYGIYRASRGR